MHLHDVLVRPIITEKNTMLGAQNKYSFQVAKTATKPLIREAVETVFKREVDSVNIVHVPGRRRRMGKQRRPVVNSPWKKAIVTLRAGQAPIEFFEGV